MSAKKKPKKKPASEDGYELLSGNKRASHLYELFERFEAGLVLTGTEVKSAREGGVTLREGYVRMKNGEAWLVDCHIAPYSNAGYATHEPTRPRKLLMHKQELRKLIGKLTLRGMTLVPLKMYLKNGRIKLEVALGKGKKVHDKRDSKKARQADRDAQREMAR